jgi:hypothetical protein
MLLSNGLSGAGSTSSKDVQLSGHFTTINLQTSVSSSLKATLPFGLRRTAAVGGSLDVIAGNESVVAVSLGFSSAGVFGVDT